MTKVTSAKDITFPSLDWGISAGTEKELPEEKKIRDRILEEDCISIVGEKVENTNIKNKSTEDKK
jgi:hypothetical protein